MQVIKKPTTITRKTYNRQTTEEEPDPTKGSFLDYIAAKERWDKQSSRRAQKKITTLEKARADFKEVTDLMLKKPDYWTMKSAVKARVKE